VTLTTIPDALTVPAAAVQIGPSGQYVFVVKPDMSAEMRPVSVLRTRGQESVLRSGVEPNETVVVDGQLRLTPGSRVSVKPAVGEKRAS
jgi:multidrug efflux system membrane fusion protein